MYTTLVCRPLAEEAAISIQTYQEQGPGLPWEQCCQHYLGPIRTSIFLRFTCQLTTVLTPLYILAVRYKNYFT